MRFISKRLLDLHITDSHDSTRVLEQPFKIPFVAAVVLAVNAQKSEVAAEVLKKAGESLQSALNLGEWRNTKLILRFLSCLHGIFDGDGVFPILEELFARAVDLQTASSEDVSTTGIAHNRKPQHADVLLLLVFGSRACQDYPFHDSLCDGIFKIRLRDPGVCTFGENRHHCFYPSCSRSTSRSFCSGRG